MNVFATLLAVFAIFAAVSAHCYGGVRGGISTSVTPTSVSASAPCAKNYLFSCQPSLATVPCGASTANYGGSYGSSIGSAGAYSENVPSVINAPYHYQGMPSNFLQVPDYYTNY